MWHRRNKAFELGVREEGVGMAVSIASGGQHPAFPMGMLMVQRSLLVNDSVSAPFSSLFPCSHRSAHPFVPQPVI